MTNQLKYIDCFLYFYSSRCRYGIKYLSFNVTESITFEIQVFEISLIAQQKKKKMPSNLI